MSHYTANVKLYWNGTAVNATQGVLAFGVGDTVPDATVTRDSLFTGGFVTSQPDGGTPTPFTPISREIANATYNPVLTDPATMTYNGDGTVATVTVQGVTTTYTYNGDGTVATEARGGTTRTYTYTGGNLTGVA